MKKIIHFYLIFILFFGGCIENNENKKTNNDSNITTATNTNMLNYKIVAVYAHNEQNYTQGLAFYNGKIYEGTGMYDKSILSTYSLENIKPTQQIKLDKKYFGEGITIFKNKIYQLTWREHKVFVYDLKTFKKIQEFNWTFEGWGITHNDSNLIISTGSSNLYFVNPTNFKIIKTLGVYDKQGYIDQLNELEFVDNNIYANVYLTDNIIQINAQTGEVEKKADLSNLFRLINKTNDPKSIDAGYVLNGIAYNPSSKNFYITGKCWDVMVEVTFY
ncbi:MAG: glutaminyl-peptide cyclotransferase [Sediminibacterium sp.]|nr:glutaminyl-peptide cyclotransferase [Sediminibacterium sp.]